ncbi:kinase-like domain-containing protein [Pavlovales sp. CCMP2436]|nr:kinase-like domain-containing protein [Pavlovales sp. CCMP2436]
MSIRDFQLKKFLGKGVRLRVLSYGSVYMAMRQSAAAQSYGSVYMAMRQSDGKQYAIKKVDTRRMNTKERQEAVNEIRVLASVGGPFNIRFLEAFVDADVLYIVTEFAGNGDLFGWLKARKGRGLLKEATVWSFIIQMCYGLQSLHERNILHRDLKGHL